MKILIITAALVAVAAAVPASRPRFHLPDLYEPKHSIEPAIVEDFKPTQEAASSGSPLVQITVNVNGQGQSAAIPPTPIDDDFPEDYVGPPPPAIYEPPTIDLPMIDLPIIKPPVIKPPFRPAPPPAIIKDPIFPVMPILQPDPLN